jgi:uncharacterized protein YjbI with pentapeptide repeats
MRLESLNERENFEESVCAAFLLEEKQKGALPMITGFSLSEQKSQWSQASSGIWVPKTPRPTQHQSSSPHQDGTQHALEEAHPDWPASTDHEGWKRYWAEHGWTWRRESEISAARKAELTQRRAIPVDIKQGIYPFRGMTLTRADIEWLLATHDGGQGPVDWNDALQRAREGLDLRGVVVPEGMDLSALPLARLRGSLEPGEWDSLTEEQRAHALLCLKRAHFSEVHLEEACLRGVHLEGANLYRAHLEGANLYRARLEGANLSKAHLEGANLYRAHLEGADLYRAHLEGTDLGRASLAPVNLTGARLANATGVGPSLADVKWGETNLSVVDWSHVQMLGDEYSACQSVYADGKRKTREARRKNYQDAHRANHQLAVVLQDQGLVDDATRFAYRAKCLKRTVLWYDLLLAKTMRQRFQISWSLLFSWALFLLAGYGYRLRRCLFWYVGIVLAFLLLYWWLDPTHLPWWVALGESVNVFHGRGATPAIAQLAHPVWFTLLTVVEAMIGLVIEVVFVATMIQRLFGK